MVNTVFAVDPAAGMLKQSQALATERGIRYIRWQQGDPNAAQLGEQKGTFEEDLRRALLAYDPWGRYEEAIRTKALIATR